MGLFSTYRFLASCIIATFLLVLQIDGYPKTVAGPVKRNVASLDVGKDGKAVPQKSTIPTVKPTSAATPQSVIKRSDKNAITDPTKDSNSETDKKNDEVNNFRNLKC